MGQPYLRAVTQLTWARNSSSALSNGIPPKSLRFIPGQAWNTSQPGFLEGFHNQTKSCVQAESGFIVYVRLSNRALVSTLKASALLWLIQQKINLSWSRATVLTARTYPQTPRDLIRLIRSRSIAVFFWSKKRRQVRYGQNVPGPQKCHFGPYWAHVLEGLNLTRRLYI